MDLALITYIGWRAIKPNQTELLSHEQDEENMMGTAREGLTHKRRSPVDFYTRTHQY